MLSARFSPRLPSSSSQWLQKHMPLADAMLRFKKHDHFFGKPDGQNGTEDGAEFSDLETIVRFIPNSNISNKANLQSSESFSNKGIAEGITTVGG